MTRVRWLLLLLGPVPILVGSVGLTRWCRPLWAESPIWNAVHRPARASGAAGLHVPPDLKALAHHKALQAACAETAAALQPRLGERFSLLVRPPYVVAGNLAEAQLSDWHAETIAPATAALARRFIDTLPDLPITVLLFADATSYEQGTRSLFGEQGVSVFGYYKPQERTLVLDMSTGAGTLVHELTHALLAFDFPTAPDWFNEGLASLYEECRLQRETATIEGLVNWRLLVLQDALRREQLRPIRELMSDGNFRADEGRNYAHARYLCMYLEQQGALDAFYLRFRDQAEKDPRGLESLQFALQESNWETLERDFRSWVGALGAAR